MFRATKGNDAIDGGADTTRLSSAGNEGRLYGHAGGEWRYTVARMSAAERQHPQECRGPATFSDVQIDTARDVET